LPQRSVRSYAQHVRASQRHVEDTTVSAASVTTAKEKPSKLRVLAKATANDADKEEESEPEVIPDRTPKRQRKILTRAAVKTVSKAQQSISSSKPSYPKHHDRRMEWREDEAHSIESTSSGKERQLSAVQTKGTMVIFASDAEAPKSDKVDTKRFLEQDTTVEESTKLRPESRTQLLNLEMTSKVVSDRSCGSEVRMQQIELKSFSVEEKHCEASETGSSLSIKLREAKMSEVGDRLYL